MIELIRKRLDSYSTNGAADEQQALGEIMQEVALYALWRAGFFKVAAFQGGTSLRILHGLPRFSEDLDFILKTPDPVQVLHFRIWIFRWTVKFSIRICPAILH